MGNNPVKQYAARVRNYLKNRDIFKKTGFMTVHGDEMSDIEYFSLDELNNRGKQNEDEE